MRIRRIELRHTKMELVSPFETSLGVELYEEHIIVRVDGDGVAGWGECVVEPAPSYSRNPGKGDRRRGGRARA